MSSTILEESLWTGGALVSNRRTRTVSRDVLLLLLLLWLLLLLSVSSLKLNDSEQGAVLQSVARVLSLKVFECFFLSGIISKFHNVPSRYL